MTEAQRTRAEKTAAKQKLMRDTFIPWLLSDQYVPAIMPLSDEDDKIDRHIQRVKDCGKPMFETSPTGKIKRGTYTCGYWRDCPHCMKRRANMYREIGDNIFVQTQGDALVIQVSETEAQAMTRGVDRSLFTRFPQIDGSVVLIANRSHVNFADVQSEISIDDIDWLTVMRTPKGKRMSGSLGKNKPAPATPGEDPVDMIMTVEVNTVQIVIDFGNLKNTDEVIRQAKEAAYRETGELEPNFDGDELTHAMNTRTLKFGELLVKAGAKISGQVWKRRTIKFNTYEAWDVYRLTALEKYQKVVKMTGMIYSQAVFDIFCSINGLELASLPVS